MAIPYLQDSSLRLTDCIFFGDSIAEAAFSGTILDGSVTLAKLAPEVTAVAIGGAAASHNHAAGDITSATSRILGRVSAGAGNVEELTGAQVLALAGGAAVSHAHAAADITSGTLPVTRGGTGVDMWPNVVGGGDQGNIVFTTGHSTPLTASQKLYAIPEVGSPTENVGVFLNYRRYFAGNQPPSAPLHVVANIGAGGSPEERVVAMFGANANPSIYGQRRTVSVMMGHAPDGTDQGKLLPESSGRLSYSWDHPVWNAGPIPASPYTQEFFISVPTALGSPTKILGCKGDGTTNAYHGMNVYDGQLVVEAKKGLIDTGDCAVQVTSEVVAGAGERAAIYLQGLGTGGYAALKMGCNAKGSEFMLKVGDGIDGLEIVDTNAGETRVAIDNVTGDVRLLGNTFIGNEAPSATPRSLLEITRKATSLGVGFGAALRVNAGDEPNYGTPLADTNIAAQLFSNNVSMVNADLWGLNVVTGHAGPTTPDPTVEKSDGRFGIHVVGAEFEVISGATAGNFEADPLGNYQANKTIRLNGVEIIIHGLTEYMGTCGLMMGAGDEDTTTKWWKSGIALAHVRDHGIRFMRTDGQAAGAHPFQLSLFDAAELTQAVQPFLLARSSGDVRYDIKNGADHSVYLNIDTGSTAANEAAFLFSDRGSRKWLIGKDSSNHLQIGWNDGATAVSAFSAYVDDEGTPTAALIGFYGTAPTAKPTVAGSKGGNAALASLLTALATLGLITDSTT